MVGSDWRERCAVKDERGNTYDGWRVLSRAPNAGGLAMWRCQCVCCGEHRVIAGIKLRAKPPGCACQKPRKP